MKRIYFIFISFFLMTANIAFADINPLPSWNEGASKKAIFDFVQQSALKSSPQYIAPQDRVATFDQDGTLWVEYPMYTQVMFAFDQIIELSKQHPEWKKTEPFKSIIEGNKVAIKEFTPKDLEKIVMATHAGMSVEAFQATVNNWLQKAKHSRWGRPYTQLTYQPMLELLKYLRDNGFKTYIVTGGGQDFVRVYSEHIYGIPPEQVIGSALKTRYSYDKRGKGILIRTSTPLLNNDFAGKPEDIYLFIGKRPVAAVGNSTGDQQMLEYAQSKATSMMLLVHHDDEKREYAYGPNSKVGTFSDALMQEAKLRGWQIVSMKNDWKRIFAFEKPSH